MRRERRFYTYIVTNKPWGTLYIGMTNDIMQRVHQHREGLVDGFTKKYGLKNLVYFEEHATALGAIHREKRMKKWPRVWKINLIRTNNPDWKDLAADWFPKMMTPEEIGKWLESISP
ncbi:MAG TPA: GIY-YIG nuclease family protein [Rhizomicrobium sp.]|nr:GIY-YIG nuclease family protein [Rhizomicrobium sp.]